MCEATLSFPAQLPTIVQPYKDEAKSSQCILVNGWAAHKRKITVDKQACIGKKLYVSVHANKQNIHKPQSVPENTASKRQKFSHFNGYIVGVKR